MGKVNYKRAATFLEKMFNTNFGGKDSGRFIIAKVDLAKVAGLRWIYPGTQEKISEALQELPTKLLICDMGSDVAIIKSSTVDRWRVVPKHVLKTLNENKDIDNEEDDEEETKVPDLNTSANSTLSQQEPNPIP